MGEPTFPPAGTPKADLQAAWTIERSRILAERYAATRKAQEEGRDIHFVLDPPPPTPPSYWRVNTGEATVTPLAESAEVNPDPSTVKIRWPYGRRTAGENEPTVEEIFAREQR